VVHKTHHPLTNNSWIVCQIGARENYTVPRALQKVGRLDTLLTDLWHEPTGFIGNLMSSGSMFQRWHADLVNARVWAPNRSHLLFEAVSRLRSGDGGRNLTIRRNEHFQRHCVRYLQQQFPSAPSTPKTVFAFSYAARDIFQWAKSQGHTTVLGQIDPGPFEEELVRQEHQRYPDTGSTWKPAPPAYWKNWREETALADFILVNSEWARQGLISAGVAAHKIRLVPLFCEDEKRNLPSSEHLRPARAPSADDLPCSNGAPHLEISFLGNVCLRKGIARLIEAMRMLQGQPIRLSIYGPLSVSPSLWDDLPNVRWVGTIRNADIRQIYASADAFILPTISDGFARTQLEALASGTPILVSGHCGHVVLHGINGFLLKENTPAEIAGLLSGLSKERSLLAQCDTSRLPEDMPQSLDGLARMLLDATK
jgi:glycosyltransferase involved in cell wall biosynthesis